MTTKPYIEPVAKTSKHKVLSNYIIWRRWFILVAVLLLFAILTSCSKKSSFSGAKKSLKGEKPPNLIIFEPDQWAGFDLGFLGAKVKTPNLDRFASQGLVLTNAIANYAVCSPSRAMLMSGQYPVTNGVMGNVNSGHSFELKKSTTTWSDVLYKEGYRLGYTGKWHLSIAQKPYFVDEKRYINVYGKSHRAAVWLGWVPPDERHHFNFWYNLGQSSRMKPLYWTTYAPQKGWFHVNRWEPAQDVNAGIKFIENKKGMYRDPNKPFALMVAPLPPHSPYSDNSIPKKYRKIYQDVLMDSLTQRPNIPPKGTSGGDYYRRHIKNYFAMMTGVDRQFGRLLKALKENGLEENTIVLFTSDHGNCLGIHGKKAKNNPYECADLVPFIMRYPGHIQPGRNDSLLLSTPDIYPTVLDLMGLKAKIPPQVEGKSYAWSLTGGQGNPPYYQVYYKGKNPKYGLRGLRTHKYTFVLNYQKSGFVRGLLFNRKNDPHEMKNLYDSHPKLAKQFKLKLKTILKKRNDPWVRNLE